MTNGDTSGARSHSSAPKQGHLALDFGGLKGAIWTLVAAGAVGFFTVAMIVAVVNGKLLWVSIPLALICGVVFLVFASGIRRSAIRHGLIIDDKGVHTTLRGTQTASFTWETIDAIGLSYVILKSGENGTRTYPGMHNLDLFCSSSQHETPVAKNKVGYPVRVDDSGPPDYGISGGHMRIGLSSPSKSERQRIRAYLAGVSGARLIEDFERPRFPGGQLYQGR